jgi:hypothetical protein
VTAAQKAGSPKARIENEARRELVGDGTEWKHVHLQGWTPDVHPHASNR